MNKIMFNDKYGLTKSVLEGRKTQTRRITNTAIRFITVSIAADILPLNLFRI